MKCKNCACQVSSDFKHSFMINCCPKCGKQIMTEDVKNLFIQMDHVLAREGNDMGDLAVWFVDNFLKKPEIIPLVDSPTQDVQVVTQEITLHDTPLSTEQNVVNKKPTPIKRTQAETNPNTERANLFAKRAGVDKIKYETLVRDIQGVSEISATDSDIGDGDQEQDILDENYVPLSDREMHTMSGLFNAPEENSIDFTELQKIQKLEQLSMTGSLGKIKRSM